MNVGEWYERLKSVKELREDNELYATVKTIIDLQFQIKQPSRIGMLNALQNAQQIAQKEIVNDIQSKGGTVISRPWSDYSDHELYEKLLPYQSSLMEHGRKIVGNGLFEKLINDAVTTILGR